MFGFQGRPAGLFSKAMGRAVLQRTQITTRRLFSTVGTGVGGRAWAGSRSRLGAAAAVIGGLTAFIVIKERDNIAHACGIIGFVGTEQSALPFLLEGLTILQNRGYDSAGVATVDKNKGSLTTCKFASMASTSDSIDRLKVGAQGIHGDNKIGIAHTRWATHGGKTDANAHPHLDYLDRVAVVHNGVIENYAELREELNKDHKIPFRSETDTEVIAQMVGHYLDQNLSFVDAVKRTLTRLEGTWGLVFIHKDHPDQMIAARNGSPLIVGIGQGRMFVASEIAAFTRHTNEYIALTDGEMAIIDSNGVSLDLSRKETAPAENIQLDPAPYKHWTLKEIMEQPKAISRVMGYGGRFDADGFVKLGGLDDNKELMLSIQNIMVSGCGTSLFAGEYGVKLMRNLKCFDTVYSIDAAEVGTDSFPRAHGGVCVLSQSGETKDTHRCVVHAENLNLPRFSVINQVGSLIARTTNCGVYLNAGREHAVASTKAFTTQVTAMALVSGWFAQNREHKMKEKINQRTDALLEAVHRLPTYAGMTLRTHQKCKELAEKLKEKDHMFVLGKGFGEPIAKEGALKIKEITYIRAEGYSGGALKHGPFALLEKGTPVILLVLDDQHAELMRIAASEVRARGAYTIVITDKVKLAEGVSDEVIPIPANGPLTALLAVIPLQLLAYEVACLKGINPDKPRNLAKAVTVD